MRSPRGHVARPLALVALLLAGCAAPIVPIGVGDRRFELAEDERALWAQAAKEEEILAARLRLLHDPLLGAYLQAVTDRLMPPEVGLARGPQPRVTVVLDPTLGAFAMPDGRVYLHTGLLAALRSEVEVAVVVGRALAHVIHRDALRLTRRGGAGASPLDAPDIARRVHGAVAAGAREEGAGGTGAAVIGTTASVILGRGLRVAATASMRGYPEDLEREADRATVNLLVRAGYDPRGAAETFDRLAGEAAGRGPIEMSLMGQGAFLRARGESFTLLLRPLQGGARAGPEALREFDARLPALLRENAALDARAGRFDRAERQLDRVLATTPDDPVAQIRLGDLDRLRAQHATTARERGDLEAQALRRYERAMRLVPGLAEPHRQIGLLRHQRGDRRGAREAFERYLALRPDAPDAARIREYARDPEP